MKLKFAIGSAVIVMLGLGALALLRPARAQSCVVVEKAPFSVVSVYEGEIQARKTEMIMADFSPATIVEIADEGSEVQAGDVVVRFDSSKIKENMPALEKDHSMADAQLASLEHAEIPLQLSELELKLTEARVNCDRENRCLKDTETLLEQGLVAEQEVAKQKNAAEKAEMELKYAELKLQLTRSFLHPTSLAKSRTAFASAEKEIALATQQLNECTVTAPIGGFVVYKPVWVQSEHRCVRVGDSIYRNQPFLMIPDMTNLTVHCNVPEAELPQVRNGKDVVVTPVAYPELKLSGKIETIASMAQPVAGMPSWQKFFRVVIGLLDHDPRLRPGMSVNARVVSYEKLDALLVPRAAVTWRDEAAYCRIVTERGLVETRKVELGQANTSHYEVMSGLRPGDRVALE